MKILLVNEVNLLPDQMKVIEDGLKLHANKVAAVYGLEPVEITSTTFVGNFERSLEFLQFKSVPKVYITERNRKTALAWRDRDGNGTPVVFASLRASVKPFGVYKKPFVLKGRQISPARMRSGLISVLAHEISELIVSPYMDNFTLPDAAGKSWRKEVCDPVLGAYYYEQINGTDCVFPDFVLPSFWDTNAVGPYSYLGTAKAPMVWASGSYAWFRSGISKLLTRVTFP